MGFGSVGYMNTVMKNNRNLLRNHSREKFKRSTSTLRSEKVAYNLPKSTPQSLRQIREKMKFENEHNSREIRESTGIRKMGGEPFAKDFRKYSVDGA